jgi:flagellar biosynthesis/type III secretory pathway protein FliH
MFGQPAIILSKPIKSVKIENTRPTLISSENGSDVCGSELTSHTQINSDLDGNAVPTENLQAQKTSFLHTCQLINNIADKLNKFNENIIKEHKEEIAKLSVEIARKILFQKVEKGDYEIESIVKEALSNVPTRQDVEVHLNPDDLVQCQKTLNDELNSTLSGIKLVSDPNIKRAECSIKTPKGIIQSFIDEHLEQIGEALVKVK